MAVLIFILSTASHAKATSGTDLKNETVAQSTKKVKKKKSLLSALFLLNLIPTKKHAVSAKNMPAVPKADRSESGYRLSSLKTPGMRKDAVESLYAKHGFNNLVRKNLQYFSRHKYSFSKRLRLSGRYVNTMADIFSEEELPYELVFLPLIESGFKTDAYSHKKAAGPWQFMPVTAKKLGLKMDWWIDERRDPVKSTKAAARYLKYLHKKFGSWNLALAAYNAGEGRIDGVIRRVGDRDFWRIRETRYISGETKNYIPSYVAAAAIAMDPENYGFKNIEYQKPFRYDEVVINDPMDLEVVAWFTGADIQDIKELNPELRRLCTPPNVDRYTLKIPDGTKRKFLANLSRHKGRAPQYLNLYTVRPGDTIEKIAKRLGSTIQALINMNGLGRKALIFANEEILVPLEYSWDKVISQTRL